MAEQSYLQRKRQNSAREEEKNQIIFGLMGGVILMIAAALTWLSSQKGLREIVCIFIFALGVLFFMLAIVVPSLLKYPYKAFRFWGNLVGRAVFTIVLTILYFLLVFPVGLLLRRKRAGQGYYAWAQAQPKARSMFIDIAQTDIHNDSPMAMKASYFLILYKLLAVFIANKKYVFIPVVVLLTIAGLILFFVSSNVMTAFIYTLF